MNSKLLRLGVNCLSPSFRHFSASSARSANYSCKLLVIGGGTGGCTMASKFCRHLGEKQVVVLEPNELHYYQPLWTLVGAGAKTLKSTARTMLSVLPSKAIWMRDAAGEIQPENNTVLTKGGDLIQYEYLIIASGIETYYDKIPGLLEGLKDQSCPVATIYSAEYCTKMWTQLQKFDGGHAVFTFPDTFIKCPGAPQKIAYLSESYFTQRKIRQRTSISYNSSIGVLFGVKKYCASLEKVAQRKKINVNLKTVLKEVRPHQNEAVFHKTYVEDNMAYTCEDVVQYDLLHVAPPMRTPDFIRNNPSLSDVSGCVDVDKYTLQHTKYQNVYGIGDCTNTPNSKTAAAIAKQCFVVDRNLRNTMKNKDPIAHYDGYGACPLLTEFGKCILAEFLYDGKVHETFPYDQSKESKFAYHLKKTVFPLVYWNLMLKGRYHGPEMIRKMLLPFRRAK